MGHFVHQGWGTKPPWNKQTRADIKCNHCGETDITKLEKDKRRAFGVSNRCRRCYNERYNFTPQRRAYKQAWSLRKKEELGRRRYLRIQVLYDPSGTYQRNSFFRIQDFNLSLKGRIWPDGMIVRNLIEQQCYKVHNTELVEVPERDWFVFRQEMANA